MSKSKTFKLSNELTLDYNTDAWHSDGWGWEVGGEVFPDELYEVEITFTKKVKPPRVGDKALSPSGVSECEIAAIDGDEVWLRYSDGSHSTIDKDKLIYAS